MLAGIRSRLTFANVISVIALFIALGAGAYAAGLKPDSVKSKHIVDGQVKGRDLGEGTISFLETNHWQAAVTQPGSGSEGSSSTFPAEPFDRLVFFSFEANRTAASGTTDYLVRRPGDNVNFQLTGTDSKSGEGFFVISAGDGDAPDGVNIQADDFTGSGGTLNVDYREFKLQEPPPD